MMKSKTKPHIQSILPSTKRGATLSIDSRKNEHVALSSIPKRVARKNVKPEVESKEICHPKDMYVLYYEE